MKSFDLDDCLSRCVPVALGVISGGMACLCLWITAALLQIAGTGVLAFATASGALFWGSGVFVAVMFWNVKRDREREAEFGPRREALRNQLRMGRTA